MIKKIILIYFLIISHNAYSIVYYKSNSSGDINVISKSEFEDCEMIIYRKPARKELSRKHKKALLKALITGAALNSFEIALKRIKSNFFPGR